MPVHLGAPVHPADSRPAGCRDAQAHHRDAQQGVELVKLCCLCCRYAGQETGVEQAPDAAGQALGDSQGQPVE